MKDKYDVLADVVAALRDFNKEVAIETLNAKDTGGVMSYQDGPQIPTKRTKANYTGMSLSRMHAQSVTIGNDISIKRIQREPTRIKTDKNEYDVDNGAYWVVRTPNGEAMFDDRDKDFMTVWSYALVSHDGHRVRSYQNFYDNLRNEKLKKIAGGPAVLKSDVDKYADAKKKLNSMGVQPHKLAEYIAAKTGSKE